MARAPSAHDFVAANDGFTLDTDANFRRSFEPALAARMIRAAH